MTQTLLCNVEDIPDGDAKGFDPSGIGHDTIFVIRRGRHVTAFKNSCPHMPDTTLEWKKDAFLTHDKTQIFCAGHGAIFDLDSGLCVRGACLGQKLTPIELEVLENEIFLITEDS